MKICWGFTSSFCTLSRVYPVFREIAKENEIIPVCSNYFSHADTRFGEAGDHIKTIEEICGRKMITSLTDAEPVGPRMKPDIMVIAPMTGNTLGKIASGIYDTPVTLAAKAHLRSGRPLVVAFSSNDGLSLSFANIADMFCRKNVYFVPMREDDPVNKPYSLVADFTLIPEAIEGATMGKQLFPLFKN